MIRNVALSLVFLPTIIFAGDLVEFVRPEVGTVNSFELSTGNVYPCIGRPWGMHSYSPITKMNADGSERWFYDYTHPRFYGIKLTHQLSPWIGDYATLVMLPVNGKVAPKRTERFSWYSHKAESIAPHRYEAYLSDCNATFSLAPAMRSAAMEVRFGPADNPGFVIDPLKNGEVSLSGSRVTGKGVSDIVAPYEAVKPQLLFVLDFNTPIVASEKLADGALLIRFAPMPNGGIVHAKLGASFISHEQAAINLRELGDGELNRIAAEGRKEWNSLLERVQVESDDVDKKRMFYTCLYRMLLFPKTNWEVDAKGKTVHRSPADGKVRGGYWYSGTCFWDTFRALFPFLNRVYPEMSERTLEWLANCWKEYGWLPALSSPGITDCMIGNNVASVIADAYQAGVKGDYDALLNALVHETENAHPKLSAIGRCGAKEYLQLGYVPRDVNIKESTARTLEYAYDDWCVAKLAEGLGKGDIASRYYERAKNWRKVFDPERKIACGRNADGSFNRDFNPFAWGGDFTEGCAHHYTWSVFHDVSGLMTAMGGKNEFERRLDEIFTMPPTADWTAYGQCIHEIREMQIMGFGQYAHGNQPIQHAIYLYAWTDHPEKAGEMAHKVMERLYHPTPDGYCGDEDNGQTSAWYVWSALGAYPVCPGSGEVALGKPLFKRATVRIPNRQPIVINQEEVEHFPDRIFKLDRIIHN